MEPIVIVGMHRSGTSLVAKILDRLGVFVGHRLEHNHESLFFIRLNDWLLRQTGGSWDNPEPISALLDRSDASALVGEYIARIVASPATISYLGYRRYLRYRSLLAVDTKWAWKDPRTTFTLPIWKQVFPTLRLIHVYRHGVDVAISLATRSRLELDRATADLAKRFKTGYHIRRPASGFCSSYRCLDVTEGFALWEKYVRAGLAACQEGSPSSLSIKYEDILSEPVRTVRTLSDYCGMKLDPDVATKVGKAVNKGRAFAFRTNDLYLPFAASVDGHPLLKQLGY